MRSLSGVHEGQSPRGTVTQHSRCLRANLTTAMLLNLWRITDYDAHVAFSNPRSTFCARCQAPERREQLTDLSYVGDNGHLPAPCSGAPDSGDDVLGVGYSSRSDRAHSPAHRLRLQVSPAATAAAPTNSAASAANSPLVPRRAAVLLSACRGKLMDMKPPAALGPLSDWEVPQRWFAHFYAVGAAWNAAVSTLFLASPYFWALPASAAAVYQTALALLQLHLVRRLLETLGLMRYPPGARMHGVAYLFGIRQGSALPLHAMTAYMSPWPHAH